MDLVIILSDTVFETAGVSLSQEVSVTSSFLVRNSNFCSFCLLIDRNFWLNFVQVLVSHQSLFVHMYVRFFCNWETLYLESSTAFKVLHSLLLSSHLIPEGRSLIKIRFRTGCLEFSHPAYYAVVGFCVIPHLL